MTREEKQKAIDALKTSVPIMAVTQEEFNDYIRTLNKVMDWLEQEPSNSENSNKSEIPTGSTTKNNLGVDCIDRAEVLKAMDTWDKFGYTARYGLERLDKDDKDFVPYVKYDDMVNCVKGMPSVTPQEPRKEHWMGGSYDYVCSNCEHSLNDLAQSMDYIPLSKPKYCPNCGAKMVELQESEV